MANVYEESLKLHELHHGKLEVRSKVAVKTPEDLSLAYTPGVAEPCRAIRKDPNAAFKYTAKGNMVAVVTDGSAVLGLGNIGAQAGLPVMEGKSILFKEFGNIDAFPICLDTQDPEEIIKTVKYIAPSFGGINLEDISAPRCFEIEKRLIDELDIPVFHDDQHGTAIVVCAGLINALKLCNKNFKDARIVISGAGSAGISIAKLMIEFGATNIILVDKAGIVCEGNEWLHSEQVKMAKITNPEHLKGDLATALVGADVLVGVSAPNIVNVEMIKSMNDQAIVFAMANPEPEIMPDVAIAAGARVVATGRSDFPNQINNVLVFPGIFRGALDVRATKITNAMKVAAAKAIAAIVSDEELKPDYIIPSAFNSQVCAAVAKAVADVAVKSGMVQK